MDKGITQEKIKDIAITASDKIYEQDDLGPVQSIKNSLNIILTQITQVAQYLQDNEYEITTAGKNEEKVSMFNIKQNGSNIVIFSHFIFSHYHLYR